MEERPASIDEWERAATHDELTGVLACGTAAGVTSVGHVRHSGAEFAIDDGGPGPVAARLRRGHRAGPARLGLPALSPVIAVRCGYRDVACSSCGSAVFTPVVDGRPLDVDHTGNPQCDRCATARPDVMIGGVTVD